MVGAVLLALRRARARPWLRAAVGALVVVVFVVIARPTPSVLRAAVMAVIALAALASGRPRAALPALSAAVVLLLIWDPTLATSVSFAMSALASGSILVLAPGWARALRARRVPGLVAEAVAVATAAHVVSAPMIASLSGRVSLVAIPANVLAEPVVALATVFGFLAAALAPWWPAAGALITWLTAWPCRWLIAVADYFGTLRGATIGWPAGTGGALGLAALLALVVFGFTRSRVRGILAAGSLTALVVALPVRSITTQWPPPGWVFAACDVGQGDALLLHSGPGEAVEVDAGPDPVSVDHCLRDLGITRIPLLVISHYHLDHVGGLAGAVRGRTVGAVLTGPLREPAAGAHIVADVLGARRLPVRTPPVGARLQIGAVRLQVLGPFSAFHGTRSDPNNSSLCLSARVGGLRILLPGDAELSAQQQLLEHPGQLRADILKVPHHGSAYSDPRFLAAVHAQVAVISVGLHNDYGHPSPILLAALARLGVPVLRTDHDGDVAFVATGAHVRAVARGVAASTAGLGEPPLPVAATAEADPLSASGQHAEPDSSVVATRLRLVDTAPNPSPARVRMASWHPARSRSRSWAARCRRWSCWSATRSCSSIERSARAPPRRAATSPRCSEAS